MIRATVERRMERARPRSRPACFVVMRAVPNFRVMKSLYRLVATFFVASRSQAARGCHSRAQGAPLKILLSAADDHRSTLVHCANGTLLNKYTPFPCVASHNNW